MPEKSVDIFGLLSTAKPKAEEAEKTGQQTRQDLLSLTRMKDLFCKGEITINKYTCEGVQCKLCIKACPTNALYWKAGEVGIINELCVYCGACVLSCMIDDCIKISRTRENGSVEKFSKPKDFVQLQSKINATKRFQRVKDVYPSTEEYCKKYSFKLKSKI